MEDLAYQPAFEAKKRWNTILVEHLDSAGDMEIEIEEHRLCGESLRVHLNPKEIVRLHAHLTQQITRLKEIGKI